jgi:tetratricopeptide (TPR) repeat protein
VIRGCPAVVGALVAGLVGCAGPGSPKPLEPSAARFDARKAAARALEAQGEWARALLEWRVAGAWDGDAPEVRSAIASLEKRIALAVREEIVAGEGAVGEASARRHYLAALALDPGNEEALARLRTLESLRSRRLMEENAARAVPGASEADRYAEPIREDSSPPASVDPPPLTAPQLVRLAASRRDQGDLPGALEAYGRATARDPQLADELREDIETLRSELAGRAYARGLLASRSDLDAAITLFEEALEFDPGHAGALLGLKRARAARR